MILLIGLTSALIAFREHVPVWMLDWWAVLLGTIGVVAGVTALRGG